MSFKVVQERQFTHRVKIFTPVDGGHKEESLKVTYRVIDAEELDRYDLSSTQESTDFLRAVVVRIDEAIGEDDAPLPYNDELRDVLLGMPHVRAALGRGYFDGIGKGRKGN